ncbi:MAG: STAS domain-containing protein [Pseudomonadota bacterium]
MSNSKVYYTTNAGIHGLKFVGQIRYTIGASLDKFIRSLFDGPKPKGFMVDLRETETIDSTNLGLLAHIANLMKQRGAPKVTLVSTNEDINTLLFSIGFDEVFDIVDEVGHAMTDSRELALQDNTGPDMARTVLDAHRTLISIGDDNKARFKDVVELLEQQLVKPRRAIG